MHLVEAKHLDSSFKKNPSTNLSPESLGFLSLVVTYAKAWAQVNPDDGIKHTSPIMPRTDSVTIYDKFVEADLKWKNDLATPPKSTALKIEKWMNGLEIFNFDLMKESDKTIDGQIGGLGDRMETLYNSPSISALIFEFRDLIVKGGSLPTQLKAVEDALIQSHKDFNQAPVKALA